VPELSLLLEAIGTRRIVLDGELVAGDGSPDSFYRLGPRLAATRAATVEPAHHRDPVTLVVFDVLWLDNGPLVDLPYRERRCCLESLHLSGAHWTTIPSYEDGEALLAACEAVGVEGEIAKAVEAPYRSGRSSAWVKRKSVAWQTKHAARRRPGSRRPQEAQVS
jgi:bifunctional non-homologous end joining protein LigD